MNYIFNYLPSIVFMVVFSFMSHAVPFLLTHSSSNELHQEKFNLKTTFSEALKIRAKQAEIHLFANISRSDTPAGFIIASPFRVNPDYYFHWVRDAALVMRSLSIYLPEKNAAYQKQVKDYAEIEAEHQKIFKLSDQGEPKFNADGTSFQGPWGRPQNDGPALRSTYFSQLVLDQARRGNLTYLKNYYQANLPAKSLLKIDYEYVSHQWYKPDFDLWEEVQGQHFYTRMVQQKAMKLAVHVAELAKDFGAKQWYQKQVDAIEVSLLDHLNDEKIILSTVKRVAGLATKRSQLDSSVILAILHTDRLEGRFSLTSEEVLKTFMLLDQTFKNLYPLNYRRSFRNVENSFLPTLGNAIGRYPEDSFYGGNPWFLLTSSFAEFCYRQALFLKHASKHVIYEPKIQKMLKSFLNINSFSQKSSLIDAWQAKGDQYLARVLYHSDEMGHQAEQMDKVSGYFKSAGDLTWSYAAFLTAVHYRFQLNPDI